jgi:hypothetical protein
MPSPNTYCTSSRVASCRIAASSPRMISMWRSEIPATRRVKSTSTQPSIMKQTPPVPDLGARLLTGLRPDHIEVSD